MANYYNMKMFEEALEDYIEDKNTRRIYVDKYSIGVVSLVSRMNGILVNGEIDIEGYCHMLRIFRTLYKAENSGLNLFFDMIGDDSLKKLCHQLEDTRLFFRLCISFVEYCYRIQQDTGCNENSERIRQEFSECFKQMKMTSEKKKESNFDIQGLIRFLDKRVVGLQAAKQELACFIEESLYQGGNVLLLHGKTGTGKTFLVHKMKEYFDKYHEDVLVIEEDLTGVTAEGFKGRDFSSIKKVLLQTIDESKCRSAFLVLNEADKLMAMKNADSSEGDVNRIIQSQILTFLEGRDKRINVVLVGSFEELYREEKRKPIGFGSNIDTADIDINVYTDQRFIEDLVKTGNTLRELLGRITYFIQLPSLKFDDMKRILVNGPLKDVKTHFSEFGVSLSISEAAIHRIVKESMSMDLGARPLKTCLNSWLRPYKYMVYSNKGEITSIFIKEDKRAVIKRRGERYENRNICEK